jgi:N-acetylmuramic acid 6-phosphate etherase
MHLLIADLNQLVSEQRNSATMDIDQLDTLALLTRINQEDQTVPLAVARQLPAIAEAVDAIVTTFQQQGRLIYIGAGTSGRLGVLDASECPPTFGVPASMVIGLIAGGDRAIRTSIEGAEDDWHAGAADLLAIHLTAPDCVVGLAASGRTPYVVGALTHARQMGCTTIALTSNPDSPLARMADIAIAPDVGPEVLTGSTRLKSGTAQKLILNMLSTASMIRLGKCYQNLMVDVQATNEKLRARAIRIVAEATGCSEAMAETQLKQTHFDVKLTILMLMTGLEQSAAKQLLQEQDGYLQKALAAQVS